MPLTSDDISRIAKLARLELAPPEHAQMLEKINSFFRIVEQISGVHTDGVEPMAHPVDAMPQLAQAVADADANGMSLRLRDDVVRETNQRQANMANAPEQAQGLFLVPKVIE